MKWTKVLEKFLILLQSFGRIEFYPSIHFISDSTFVSRDFQRTQEHELYQISASKSLTLNNSEILESYKELLVLEHLPESTWFEILTKVSSKSAFRPLVLVLSTGPSTELELTLKKVQLNTKRILDLFILTIQDQTEEWFEVVLAGQEVTLVAVNANLAKPRMNFYGQEFVGSHLDLTNFESRTGYETLERHGHQGGLDYKVLAYTQDYLNFSLKTIGPSENSTAVQKSSKKTITPNWHGISKQVKTEMSDFGISSNALLPQIAKSFRFLTPQTTTKQATLVYVMKKGAILNPYGNIFSTRSWIWIAIVLSLGLLARAVMSSRPTWVDSFVWIVAVVSQQNWEEGLEAQKTSQRMLTLTMSALCLILYTMFCSSLISSLSVGTTQEYTVSDLVNLHYKFGIANNSYLITGEEQENRDRKTGSSKKYEFFTGVSTSEVFMNLNTQAPFPATEDGMFQLLTVPLYGFIGPSFTSCIRAATALTPLWTADRICEELKSLLLLGYGVRFSTIFKKDSAFLEYFKIARMTMKERGIDSLFQRRQTSEAEVFSPSCKAKDTLVSFQIEDVYKPFSILIGGSLSAFLLLALELLLASKMTGQMVTKMWILISKPQIVENGRY